MEKLQANSITAKVRELLRREVGLYRQTYEADWLLSSHGICPGGFLERHSCAIAGIIDSFTERLKAHCSVSLHDTYQDCDAPTATGYAARKACYGALLDEHSQLIRLLDAFVKQACHYKTLAAIAQEALEIHHALSATLRLHGIGKVLGRQQNSSAKGKSCHRDQNKYSKNDNYGNY